MKVLKGASRQTNQRCFPFCLANRPASSYDEKILSAKATEWASGDQFYLYSSSSFQERSMPASSWLGLDHCRSYLFIINFISISFLGIHSLVLN